MKLYASPLFFDQDFHSMIMDTFKKKINGQEKLVNT